MRLGFWMLLTLLAGCGARSSLRVDGDATEGGGGAGGSGAGGAGGDEGGGGGVGGVEQLALGAGHSCVRTFSGDVHCWGRNGDGQLGLGHEDDALVPDRVLLDEPATFLAAGSFHTCAVVESGDLYCWGRNHSGQLGDGSATTSPEPVRVALPLAAGVPERLALGESHTCAILRRDGGSDLHCWGSSESGQMGENGSSATPVFVRAGVTDVAAGGFHTCFLDEASASVLCVGENGQLQCGVVGANQILDPASPPLGGTASAVRSGRGNHSCAIVGLDQVHCWGENGEGQLGARASEAETPASTPVLSIPGLLDVQAGFAHTCALGAGEVHCWGLNSSGQLGTAGPSHAGPFPVPGLEGVIALGVGTIHSCAMRSATEIFCWGGNDFGQLGDGTTITSNVPVPVTLP
jgi:alpha-tubulin suppressor-like RCC1 family protein